jgi:hypothetical protein
MVAFRSRRIDARAAEDQREPVALLACERRSRTGQPGDVRTQVRLTVVCVARALAW